MRNVGIVFSPTLGIPAGVLSLMLGEFERVFNVHSTGVDQPTPDPGYNELAPPVDDDFVSNRNSRSYADGEADVLLGLTGRKLNDTEEESDDADDDLDSSGTETENDTHSTSSPPTTPGPNTYLRAVVPPPSDGGPTPQGSRVHSVAAQRGLQVNVLGGTSPIDRQAAGLPSSPRPVREPASPLTATINGPRP